MSLMTTLSHCLILAMSIPSMKMQFLVLTVPLSPSCCMEPPGASSPPAISISSNASPYLASRWLVFLLTFLLIYFDLFYYLSVYLR